MDTSRPGIVAFFGSGETAPAGRRAHEWLFQRLGQPISVAILETPAGFEPNSAYVAGRIADFFSTHLQTYRPEISVIPARRRDSADGHASADILAPLLRANYIFMGPGSPTYAVRHLTGTRTWHTLVARHRLGATISLASAAVVAAGAFALPVYEIYKAGEDPFWVPGLDLLGRYGLRLALVTHWNNAEGGANLDTSRCYMGRERMDRLIALLPSDVTVAGIDEHTILVLDLQEQRCQVMGQGRVTVIRAGREKVFRPGGDFSLQELGPAPRCSTEEGVPHDVWEAVLAARQQAEPAPPPWPEDEVDALLRERDEARRRRDWPVADALRQRLAGVGCIVEDTPEGPRCARPRQS